MFGKLKEKLKGAMSVFSKKAEEEAEVVEVTENRVEDIEEVKEKKVKKEIKKDKKAKKDIVEEEKKKKFGKEEKNIIEEKTVLEEVYEDDEKESEKEKKVKEIKKKNKEEKVRQDKEVKQEKKKDVSNEDVKEKNEENHEAKNEEEIVNDKKSFFGRIKKIFSSQEDSTNLDKDVAQRLKEVKEDVVESQEDKKAEDVEKIIVVQEDKKAEKNEKQKNVELEKVIENKDRKKEIKKEKTSEEKVIIKDVIKEEVKDDKTKPGFFGKLKQSFTTKTISADKFEDLFWEMEMALLENNVSVEVIEKIKNDLKEELVDKPLPRDVPKKIEETLKRTLDEILTHQKIDLIKNVKDKKTPYIVAFFGINGAGKTTSIAKLANFLKESKLKVVLAACDTFRAAAIQQLQEHADKLDVPMIKHDYGSDAAAVAYDAIKYAEKNKIDVVLIDTAGRLHSNTNLMAELEKIIRITKPDLKIFVGESITGNDCIEQAKKFNELVQMDGAILTKVDVDDKGGAPLSISYTIGKPILFMGVGQEYKDFEEFDKEKILQRLGF